MSSFGGSDLLASYHVQLGAEADQLHQVMDQVRAKTESTVAAIEQRLGSKGGGGGGISGAFKSLGGIVAAAVGSIGTVVVGGVAAIGTMNAAVEGANTANRRLQRSFTGLVTDVAASMGAFKSFGEELQNITGKSDGAIAKMGAIGASIGALSGDQLNQAVAAASGLAAKYEHLGLTGEEAMKLIANAARGEFGGFSRLGLQLDQAAGGQANYNQVVREGLQGLRDANDQAGTTSGGLGQLWNSINEGLSAVGRLLGLGESGGTIIGSLSNLIEGATAKLSQLQPVADKVRGSIAALFGVAGSAGSGLQTLVAGVQNAVDMCITGIRVLFVQIQKAFFEQFNNLLGIVPDAWGTAMIQMWGDITTGIMNMTDQIVSWIGQKFAGLGETIANSLINLAENLGMIDQVTAIAARATATALGVGVDSATDDKQVQSRIDARNAESERLIRERQERLQRGEGAFDTSSFDDATTRLLEESLGRMTERARLRNLAPDAADGVQEMIDKLTGVSTAGLGDAARTGRGGGPQSIQTAIGELAVPGVNEQVQQQRTTNQKLTDVLAMMRKLPWNIGII